MADLTKDFISFFKDLSKNNNTEWFNENRKRYETHVKKPFAAFVEDILARVRKIDPSVKIKAADAITRINKDVRFSKDKTPYNTYVGAVISNAGKKDKSVPGLYIQLSHDKIKLFGGAFVLDPSQLKKVRSRIGSDPAAFAKLYEKNKFRDRFGTIRGEQSKRLDADLQAIAVKEPLIANKQFYFEKELKAGEITSGKLAETILEHYEAALPLNQYLQSAITGKR